ncbi:YccF domain-containing protein [Maridesulfovibrio sp.]|uniref:YccF domain-containing protein n=1 Tax=Maridesulfovibrio sp. TaxID=2795000 RepID=UPI002A18C310|nr:YccF domain-containing protein [Maridesulfovibrio sp.]
MRTLGNILWYFPFFGFINAIMFFLLGSLLVLTVVASPLGLGLIQYSKFLFAPFSWSMVSKEDLNIESNPAWEAYSTIIMILWIPFGIIFALITICQIVGLAISIVGIPVALVLAKSLRTIFSPVGMVCVPAVVANEVQRRKDEAAINKHIR